MENLLAIIKIVCIFILGFFSGSALLSLARAQQENDDLKAALKETHEYYEKKSKALIKVENDIRTLYSMTDQNMRDAYIKSSYNDVMNSKFDDTRN